MATRAVAAPAKDAAPSDLVDWLELAAFLDDFHEARVDEVVGALEIQSDDDEANDGEADAELDDVRSGIESEILRREDGLGEAYPFTLSGEGEVLQYKPAESRKASSFYLTCLLLSHVTRSAILLTPPSDGVVRDVRKRHFQILATLAAAGHSAGPAVSLGWPRQDGGSILDVVSRACQLSGTGEANAVPGNLANPAAKDGGLDMLAWTPTVDKRPPPGSFLFGQAASGHNWMAKSAKHEVEDFFRDYYQISPQCNHAFVTVCPFLIDDWDLQRSSARHGSILDRTRTPLAALRGLEMAAVGVHVEEAKNAGQLAKWLGGYRREVRAQP